MAGLAVSVVALSPSIVVVVVAALGIIGIAAVARYPLGMMLQKRRFLLIDFSDASILSVDPVDRAEVLERHPVHFVRTQILRAASVLFDWLFWRRGLESAMVAHAMTHLVSHLLTRFSGVVGAA
jgi:hypothetical protein